MYKTKNTESSFTLAKKCHHNNRYFWYLQWRCLPSLSSLSPSWAAHRSIPHTWPWTCPGNRNRQECPRESFESSPLFHEGGHGPPRQPKARPHLQPTKAEKWTDASHYLGTLKKYTGIITLNTQRQAVNRDISVTVDIPEEIPNIHVPKREKSVPAVLGSAAWRQLLQRTVWLYPKISFD